MLKNDYIMRMILYILKASVGIFLIILRQNLYCSAPQDTKILVPGAGLGRLAFEIARRGYTCQGNEFSLFMLFASNFVLNR